MRGPKALETATGVYDGFGDDCGYKIGLGHELLESCTKGSDLMLEAS